MRAAFHIDLWDALTLSSAYARLAITAFSYLMPRSLIIHLFPPRRAATTDAQQKRETFFAHSFRRHRHEILRKRQ